MRSSLLAFVLLSFGTAAAAAEPPSVYQPLAFLAGHCWRGTFPDGKRTDEHCFSWIYGGKFLRDQHTVHNPGQPDYLGETIYFWNSSQHRIEYLYIENDGGFSMGAMSTDKDELIFAPANHITDGATQSYRSRWKRSGDSGYEVITEFRSADGWVPRFKVHMEELTGK